MAITERAYEQGGLLVTAPPGDLQIQVDHDLACLTGNLALTQHSGDPLSTFLCTFQHVHVTVTGKVSVF